jgi:hypothetical protein
MSEELKEVEHFVSLVSCLAFIRDGEAEDESIHILDSIEMSVEDLGQFIDQANCLMKVFIYDRNATYSFGDHEGGSHIVNKKSIDKEIDEVSDTMRGIDLYSFLSTELSLMSALRRRLVHNFDFAQSAFNYCITDKIVLNQIYECVDMIERIVESKSAA